MGCDLPNLRRQIGEWMRPQWPSKSQPRRRRTRFSDATAFPHALPVESTAHYRDLARIYRWKKKRQHTNTSKESVTSLAFYSAPLQYHARISCHTLRRIKHRLKHLVGKSDFGGGIRIGRLFRIANRHPFWRASIRNESIGTRRRRLTSPRPARSDSDVWTEPLFKLVLGNINLLFFALPMPRSVDFRETCLWWRLWNAICWLNCKARFHTDWFSNGHAQIWLEMETDLIYSFTFSGRDSVS